MNPFFQDIYLKLKLEIKEFEQEESEILQKLEKIILATISHVNTLKNYVRLNQFQDNIDEIDYFRNIQPLFICEFIYYSLRRKHEIERFGTSKAMKAMCKRKLKSVQQYYAYHNVFITYYKSNASHLDEKYFRRNNQEFPFILDECLSLIENNSITGYDLIIARFMAYNRFSDYLNFEIKNLDVKNALPNIDPSWETSSAINWTFSKVALVELMYGLIEVGCLNNGNCDINQLADQLGKAFNFKLSNYYHTFTEIKERKQAIQFLDNLRDALHKRLEENNF